MKNLIVTIIFCISSTHFLTAAEIYARQSLYNHIMQCLYNTNYNNLAFVKGEYQNMRNAYGEFLLTDWIAAFETQQIIKLSLPQGDSYCCEYPFLNYINSNQYNIIPRFFSTLYSFLIDATNEFQTKNMTYQYFVSELSQERNNKYDMFLRRYNPDFISIILGGVDLDCKPLKFPFRVFLSFYEK